MMCVHCKSAVIFAKEDYVKLVYQDRPKEFFHGECFWIVFNKKEVIPSQPATNKQEV